MNIDFQVSMEDARAAAMGDDPDVMTLRVGLHERGEALNDLLAGADGRGLRADEQKAWDALQRQFKELDQLDQLATSRAKRRQDDRDRARRGVDHLIRGEVSPRPSRRDGVVGSLGDLGDALAGAVDEIRSGKLSTAYVDFPESRTVVESGSGGYGVPTTLGQPVNALVPHSVVMQLPGTVKVEASTGDRMRFPRFNAMTVGGTAENASLTAAATDIDAIDVVYQKFSTYETISTEAEEDWSAPALAVLGNRMLKDLGARVDLGLLEGNGNSDCVGIFNQSGVSTTSVAALPTNFDKISEAIYQLEVNDGTPAAWIMHPRTWRILSQIKTGLSGDQTTLLEPDPEVAPQTLSGLPVFTSSQISIVNGAGAGSTAGVVDTSQIVIVTRRAPRLEVSRDVAFATDAVAIRATTRIGLGIIDAAGGVSLLTDIRAS